MRTAKQPEFINIDEMFPEIEPIFGTRKIYWLFTCLDLMVQSFRRL